MSTHIVGFAPPDDNWRKMKAIYESCEAADIDIPEEVRTFFDDQQPDPAGVTVALQYPKHEAVRDWRSEWGSGFEIELDKLPKHVKIVRVYNAW